MSAEKLMLIDGNSILNRAFYGLQGSQLLATSEGVYTNAIFGFINILNRYMEEEKPQYISVAFDLKAPTFRHKEFEGYKAKRKGMPPELAVQLPYMKEILTAMNIKILQLEGFEADDILGSISLCGEQMGLDVVVVTGDKDSLQLASEKTRIKMPITRSGKTETQEYDGKAVFENFGVTPCEYIDVKGLMGDQSDNIPGVAGIGEKTALTLIQEYKSIENLYEHIDDISKKGVREKLENGKDMAFLSKRLATIDRNMPKLCEIDELKIVPYDNNRLFELFQKLEFRSFIEKMKLTSTPENEEVEAVIIKCAEDIDEIYEIIKSIEEAECFALYHMIEKVDNFTNKLTGISFSWAKQDCTVSTIYFDLANCLKEEDFLKLCKNLFENENVKKYGHDLKPFIVYLKQKGIEFRGMAFDTLVGAYLLNASKESYTLNELAFEYLNMNINSLESLTGKGKSFKSYTELGRAEMSSAAGIRSEIIFKIWEKLNSLILENGQQELFYDIELPLVSVLADMEYWGFKVNPEGLNELSHELKIKINDLTSSICELAGGEFNINSPKQLGVILFEQLGLPVIKKTKTGYSTDAEVLEQLSEKHEIVSKILEYRQLVKLQSTYVEGLLALINPKTGRIHSSFNQVIAVTGRISSTEPNLQNIPIKQEMGRKIRKVFVPKNEEYTLLDADYSQIELRVLAHITSDENMILAFKNNEDIHTITASKVFGIPMEEVTSVTRSRAKAVNFGIVYGIGDFSLSKDLGITRKEAKKYIEEYLDKYPGVRQYMHDIVVQGKEMGFVTTMFNRRRYLPELKSSNFNVRSFGERIAMNTPIQGSAADIIKIAMVKVYREIQNRGLKSRLILQVHDELLIETAKDEKYIVEQLLKDNMEKAAILSVPLYVEVKCGNSWYETK